MAKTLKNGKRGKTVTVAVPAPPRHSEDSKKDVETILEMTRGLQETLDRLISENLGLRPENEVLKRRLQRIQNAAAI